MSSKSTDYDAIVVGAGFSGIRSLWELGQLDLSAKCFEAGSDVGGAWYWNRYPGARTDSEAWVYTMNFAPEVMEEWAYHERYPSQKEVQEYLGRVSGWLFPIFRWRIVHFLRPVWSQDVWRSKCKHLIETADKYNLRRNIQFNTRIEAAHYCDQRNTWTITTADGVSVSCRYFLAATGPLSVPKEPPFAGLKSFKGEWYQAAKWPKYNISFHGKRIAIIGTGATGVQIVPKLAPVAKHLTVFQRTPNYVLPGRNYDIDDHQTSDIKEQFDSTWHHASTHPFGLAMNSTGKTIKDVPDANKIRQILDSGWECGGFHFQFETFDDLFTNQESNDIASEYVRQKIRAIVKNPETAEKLCPKYPFLSKRPPCGHFYYEAFNRPNVELVDIRGDNIRINEKGIQLDSGGEFEFDMIIFALGYDAATGALTDMDVRGSQRKSLKDAWSTNLETFAGVLVPGFPNMFSVCGPHVPFGNMPVVLDIGVSWIGKTLRYMEENKLAKIDVTEKAVKAWSGHLDDAFKATLFKESAQKSGAWFVGANIPGKASNVLFYFGGVPTWTDWLEKESNNSWASMHFSLPAEISQVG